jgi:hypothetical protein
MYCQSRLTKKVQLPLCIHTAHIQASSNPTIFGHNWFIRSVIDIVNNICTAIKFETLTNQTNHSGDAAKKKLRGVGVFRDIETPTGNYIPSNVCITGNWTQDELQKSKFD